MRRRDFLAGLALAVGCVSGGDPTARPTPGADSTRRARPLQDWELETSTDHPSMGKLIRVRANAAAYDFAERVAREPMLFSAASPVGILYEGDLQNGFGATHLLWNMAGNARVYADQRVLVVSARQMSLQLGRWRADRLSSRVGEHTCNAQALLIDDLGNLSGYGHSQEELGGIIEWLLSEGRSVAFTSTPTMEEIQWQDSRLRAIMNWGTRIFVGRPDAEDLLTILRQKVVEIGVPVPDEVLVRAVSMVGRTEDWNVRVAVGLLIMSIATANWTGQPLTEELVGQVCRSMLS